MSVDVAVILPSFGGASETVATPYGEVSWGPSSTGIYGRIAVGGHPPVPVLVRAEGADPRAVIYAAKSLGARRVLAAEVVQPISPLLEPGDLVVPADVIDQTKLRPFTFFVGKGYGFIKLNPPFCPVCMDGLLQTARSAQPRTFRGAVYVGAEGPRDASEAEVRMYRHWGADVAGSGLLPEAYLARELEICYAALAVVGEEAGAMLPLLLAAGARPHPGGCACGETMRLMKEQGVVGEDWRTW